MTRKPWLLATAVAVVAVGSLAFSSTQTTDGAAGPQAQPGAQQTAPAAAAEAAPADTTIQPIAFPHSIHAGTYKMDCMYCHFSAERSVDAGLPPVTTCAGCHRLIPGTAAPQEIEKVMGYASRAEAIPWVRVYKVSDHVHFPHMRHINAGLKCQECHGPVETMGAIQTQDPLWPGADMGMCVQCHIERGASRDCAVCHY